MHIVQYRLNYSLLSFYILYKERSNGDDDNDDNNNKNSHLRMKRTMLF